MSAGLKFRRGGLRRIELPGWYRTSSSNQRHFWVPFGRKSVRGVCGRLAIKSALVEHMASAGFHCDKCEEQAKGEK